MSELFGAAVPDLDLSGLSDSDLSALAAMVAAEQHARALAGGDLDALTEWGFENLFAGDGMPRDPEIRSGLLVVAGTKKSRSRTSHDCAWLAVGDAWVWEYEDKLSHTLRTVPGPQDITRAVSLLVPYEGLEFDLVRSKMRTGVHTATASRSFTITAGELVLVNARVRNPDHRH